MNQPTNYMAALADWTEKAVIQPLAQALAKGDQNALNEAKRHAKLAVRGKVLESYHNGQAAGPQTKQGRYYGKR
jgi:hypothetical protein